MGYVESRQNRELADESMLHLSLMHGKNLTANVGAEAEVPETSIQLIREI